MSTIDRIKSVCTELLKVEASRVQENSRFVEDLGADSMQSIELVAAFEEEFDIEMDEDAALGVKTVIDAVVFIDRVIAEG
jgi:acyl carrier protein